MNGARNVVRVDAVSKCYAPASAEEVRALDGVSFEISSGSMVALMGPSGCGKSTLLNLIGCVDLPSSGTVFLDGRSTSGLDDDALTELRRDRVGTVFQFFNLLPSMTIAENVALPFVLQRRERSEIARRVDAALASVGIGGEAGAFPAQSSGGQSSARRSRARRSIVRPSSSPTTDREFRFR